MSKLELNFDQIVEYNKLDSDQIEELRVIYRNRDLRLFLFLANHPEIGSECMYEIIQFSGRAKNNSDLIIGKIIQALEIYMDNIKENNIECCIERIRYGLYAIDRGMSYPYISYLMCTHMIDKKNIKDIYGCFINGITLARITETIPLYSVYTSEQVTQVCKALIDIHNLQYATDFLQIIKSPINSAHDMLIIRREAKKITESLKVINEISKSNKWMIIGAEDIS